MLATNIIQQKAPKALSLRSLQGIRDRNYRRALLMFVKGDGGVKELLGGMAFESGMIDAYSSWVWEKLLNPEDLLRQKAGHRDEIRKQRFVFGGEMGEGQFKLFKYSITK